VVPLDEAGAHRTGALLAKSRTADIGDAALVSLAIARTADIVTSDRADIERLLSSARARLRVVAT
jgi:PIN domain nuclease of toxin-antitoxin system